MNAAHLPVLWRSRAALLAPYAPMVAQAFSDAALELDAALAADGDESVPLAQASRIAGYSGDHLRRLARLGRIRAFRRGRRLYFYRKDLPRKGGRFDGDQPGEYDPAADARQVAALRANHGGGQ